MPSTDSIENIAFKLVENIIDNAIQIHTQTTSQQNEYETTLFKLNEDERNEKQHNVAFVEHEDNFVIKNIQWPKISEFNKDVGVKKIDEFIKNTWEYDNCWLYCIDYTGVQEKEFTNLYKYRVQWSIPTRRKPIPRFMVHVYFVFDVSKIKPKDTIVNVYYVFETQRLVHQPGSSRFRQKWLSDILSMKEALVDDCKF